MNRTEISAVTKGSKTLRKSTLISSKSTTGHFEIINPEDYEYYEKIGKGSYGIVQICKNIKTNKIFAMKIIQKANVLQTKVIEHIRNEYNILESLYHPFIVEVKGLNHRDPYTINFLMEYIPGGELYSLIKKNTKLPINFTKFYAASLVTTLEYIHSKNIIYRDLKPENILINCDGYLKLIDFGFAKEMTSEVTYTLCGTPEYCSPEMINKSGHGKGVDYWALGVLIFEMLVGKSPFYNIDPAIIYQNITRGKIQYPPGMDFNAKTLIKHLLIVDVNKRLGCGPKGVVDIIFHPFFDKFDWKGLLFKNLTPPYIPVVKSPYDTSNYKTIVDEGEKEYVPVNHDKDPFYNW